MKNKKWIVIALVVVALLVVAFAVAQNENKVETAEETVIVNEEVSAAEEEGEQAPEIVDMAGEIIEITEAYIVITAPDLGEVQVNLSEETVIEGVEALEVGQYAVIMYNGMMTRSLPPQITAQHIGVYKVEGTVTAVDEGSVVITRADNGEEVVLTLPEGAAELAAGDVITAYTTGAMTMSLPPQMNAIAIQK